MNFINPLEGIIKYYYTTTWVGNLYKTFVNRFALVLISFIWSIGSVWYILVFLPLHVGLNNSDKEISETHLFMLCLNPRKPYSAEADWLVKLSVAYSSCWSFSYWEDIEHLKGVWRKVTKAIRMFLTCWFIWMDYKNVNILQVWKW